MATVAHLMSTELVSVESGDTLAEAASVMSRRQVGSVLILTGGGLAGILTERDIVRAVSHDVSAPNDPVAHWMTRSPTCVSKTDSVESALELMQTGHFRHLPVLEGGRPVGMLSMRDLVKAGVSAAR